MMGEEKDKGGERQEKKVDATAYIRATLHLSQTHVVTSLAEQQDGFDLVSSSTSDVASLPLVPRPCSLGPSNGTMFVPPLEARTGPTCAVLTHASRAHKRAFFLIYALRGH